MKIYETNGNCYDFEAKVISCKKNNNGLYEIILDQTAFFPEGGGQSADEGTINGEEVISLYAQNNDSDIIHIVKEPFFVGQVVKGIINKKLRFSKMQNHTAEHICSGIINKLFGYDNIGFHMGHDEMTMDFNGTFTNDDIEKVEILANEAVYANLPIKIHFYENFKAVDIPYRSKKEFDTKIRIVEIEGIDACACCAPHVSYTGEIGLIKILGFQKYKGGTRISLLAGERALTELTKHYNNVKKISNALSSNPNDICQRFESLQKELINAKAEKSNIKKDYYTLIASSYENYNDNIIIFDQDASFDDMRYLVNILKEKTNKICAVFSGVENDYKFIAGSSLVDMSIVSKYLKESLNASCGGKGQMIQGSLHASKVDIINEIESIYDNTFSINFNNKISNIKKMHCIGNAPLLGDNEMLFSYLGDAGIPYSRLHDTGGSYGGGCFVDIANIFKDFNADPTNPDSYDFAFTDWLINSLQKQNVKIFYRLGSSIECEHKIKTYNIYPPKDFHKWAQICAGIIRHYNEGWANGFHYNIEYWEIWNEPDNEPEIENNPMWKGTKEEYFKLYEITSNYLKNEFPYIKIGGYASCGFYGISESAYSANANSSTRIDYFLEFFNDFLAYISSPLHKSPLDFFSWHSYSTIENNTEYAIYARTQLDKYGFNNTENILNEWNMGPDIRGTIKDASYIAGMLCSMQNAPIDMLMYYDAQVHANYGGLFDPVNKTVFKSYYAFKAFNELYKLGIQVKCSCQDKDIILLAATNTNGDCGGIMIANMYDESKYIVLDIDNSIENTECFATDENHNFEKIDNFVYNDNKIKVKLPKYSFYLLKFNIKGA